MKKSRFVSRPYAAMLVTIAFAVSLAGCPGPEPVEDTVKIPDLTGLTQAQAGSILNSLGLTLGEVSDAYNDVFAEGQITAQEPEASTRVSLGSAVDIILSLGPEPVVVPDLTGLTQSEAKTALEDIGLALGIITHAYSSVYPEGQIISQAPIATAQIIPGSVVDVTISQGPAPVVVPDLLGLTQSEAEAVLEDARLSLGETTHAFNETIHEGQIVSQTPAGATHILPGSPVDVVISKGPKPVVVPILNGLTQEKAETVLERMGLTLGDVTQVPSETELAGVVVGQEPPAGTPVLPGTSVSIHVVASDFDATDYTLDMEWDNATWQFNWPLGLAVDSAGNLFVADTNNHRVIVFDPSGDYVTEWGSRGNEDGELNSPFAIAVAEDGDVFVADTRNRRIQVFTRAGAHVATWRSYQDDGDTTVNFTRIFGITVDAHNYIYSVSADAPRVDVLTIDGQFVHSWGERGEGPGQFREPFGVGVDPLTGDVYVAKTKLHRVGKFSPTGEYLERWGESGSAPGQFSRPQGIAVDGAGNVYVAAAGNNRIQKLNSEGEFMASIGGSILRSPHGVAVDSQGNVFVADSNNNRVLRFKPQPHTETER